MRTIILIQLCTYFTLCFYDFIMCMRVTSCVDDLISCIKEDVSRAKGYINLIQNFLFKANTNTNTELKEDSSWAAVGGYTSGQPGSALVQYGMGRLKGKVTNPTVVYDNFLNDGAPQLPDDAVLKYLADSGAYNDQA
jgi:hypothetical protein